ncbi:hypothetical protein GGQ88_003523 [Novosphingobium hassiacum]|uniref:Uncharacterized protein n=1 Tax=Novosphingobium hassiacum TaxID=173676 RepID=A0A7W5ZY91_9SPHN|nr:hypothetical protein [Novosphingobium hassiacum]MBB3862225.1 hypothetical protein [Novosphingobium hassiacum]
MNVQPVERDRTACNWQIAMQHFLQAEAEYQRVAPLGDVAAQDDACNAYSDARWDLIRMGAPDLPALRWKLDYILEGSNGSLDPYGLDHLTQIKRDIAALMSHAPDSSIKEAWGRRLTALRIYNTLTPLERGGMDDERSPAAQACWDEIDAADEIIRAATATTIEGARIQLHAAMLGMIDFEKGEVALITGDMEGLAERDEDFEYPMRLAFSALRSLSAMEKAA